MTVQDLEYLGRAARLIIILFCYGIQMHTVHQMLVPGCCWMLPGIWYLVPGTKTPGDVESLKSQVVK